MDFKKGNIITTNKLNAFEVIGVNEFQIVCKDLLCDDFVIFSRTEHDFELFDLKLSLRLILREILSETEISESDEMHVINQMNRRIDNWII